MNWFEKIIYALQFQTTKPELWGAYHISVLCVVAFLSILVILLRKKISRKCVNVILLLLGLFLLIFEIAKQTMLSLHVVDGKAVWSYAWSSFPFQFCSVPIYLMIIAGVLRKGKVYDAILGFLATFALFGGLITLLYPAQVLSAKVFLSIHTMVWHGFMVVLGIMLLATKSVELKFKTVWKACIIFAIVLIMALTMNYFGHKNIPDVYFNMFYLSPYYEYNIPILNTIKNAVPYYVLVLAYTVGFIMMAMLIMAVAIMFNKLYERRLKK